MFIIVNTMFIIGAYYQHAVHFIPVRHQPLSKTLTLKWSLGLPRGGRGGEGRGGEGRGGGGYSSFIAIPCGDKLTWHGRVTIIQTER